MEHLQQWLSGELELSWAGQGSPQPYLSCYETSDPSTPVFLPSAQLRALAPLEG